jgi:hypothetical protein
LHVESPIYRDDARYIFSDWIELSSTYNPLTINLNGDMNITAQFIARYCLDLTVATEPSGTGGITSLEPGSHEEVPGSSVYVSATPYQGFIFSCWMLDGIFIEFDNPICVTMDCNHQLEAFFTQILNLTITVHSIPSGSGSTTNPPPGTYTYQYGNIVGAYAIADGTYFSHWELDGQIIYPDNPIIFAMNSNHNLSAHFIPPPTGGGDSCPALLAWNYTGLVNYGVIDIHNPTGQDVVREVSVLKQDLAVEGYVARLRLIEGWPTLNFSESVIDQVKLYAVDNYGNRHLCPLFNATHSQLGNVLLRLLFSDNWKAQTLLLDTVDLKFLVPYPQNLIQNYVFVIEGCNQYKQ